MSTEYEPVYTMTDYWDGPRRGIASFKGTPHFYESLFDEAENEGVSTFLLMPINEEIFQLALEDWAIWQRWLQAFQEGRTTRDTHPALPQDRPRHEVIKSVLEERLIIDPATTKRAKANFRVKEGKLDGAGQKPLEVSWKVLDED